MENTTERKVTQRKKKYWCLTAWLTFKIFMPLNSQFPWPHSVASYHLYHLLLSKKISTKTAPLHQKINGEAKWIRDA